MKLPELPPKVTEAMATALSAAQSLGYETGREEIDLRPIEREAEKAQRNLVLAIREWGASLQQQQEKSAVTSDSTQHPVQPLQVDPDGVLRFKPNAIVRFLLDAGPFDMNKLALMPWSDEDRCQFAQLIGYSLSGYSDLSYVSDAEYARAEASQ
jgi:hypothetical protein